MTAPKDSAEETREREFDLVVAAHERRLGLFLVQMVGRSGLAEDLLQETFLVAFQEREQLDQVENVTAWLFAIARNRALHALRARRRSEAGLRRLAALLQEPAPDPPDAVAVRDLLERHLDPDERALLILRYIHGFDSTELAEIVEASPEAVRQRLSRIRRRLLDVLGERVAEQPEPPRRPGELTGPDLTQFRREDEVRDGLDPRRLTRFLAPLAALTPVGTRPANQGLRWFRPRKRRSP